MNPYAKAIAGILGFATLFGLTAPVGATPVTLTWNTCVPTCAGGLTPSVRTTSGGSPSGSTEANVIFTFQSIEDATQTIVTRAFKSQNLDGTGNALKAEITIYTGGLGANSSVYPASSDEGSPQHAVDNVGPDEFIVYELPADGTQPLSFKIGYKYTDADVMTWIGGTSALDLLNLLAAETFNWNKGNTLVSTYGFVSQYFDNVPTNTAQLFSNGATGRYLIIGANTEPTTSSGSDGGEDKFKILQATVQVPVPEPSTLALLAGGLLALGAAHLARRASRGSRSRA